MFKTVNGVTISLEKII